MSQRPVFCVSSFYFAQEPLFQLPSMQDVLSKMANMASDRPIQFVGLTTFLVLGGVPIAAFLGYAIATLLASAIGLVLLELFLLAIGVAALAIALCVVLCASGCIVSVFASLYYSYQFAVGTVKKARRRVPPHSGSTSPSYVSETQPDESLDKNKSSAFVEIDSTVWGRGYIELLEGLSGSSDFCRTAVFVLVLCSTVFVMSVLVGITGYLVINFT